jgi:hypothetical protein
MKVEWLETRKVIVELFDGTKVQISDFGDGEIIAYVQTSTDRFRVPLAPQRPT